MNSDAFSKRVLEIRQKIALEVAVDICEKEKLPYPKVNFNGCPQETQFELAHYHPELNKICISNLQLYKLRTREAIRDTMFHELAHMIAPDHSGTFTKAKERFYHEGWRPPSGVIYHGPEYYARKAAEAREAEESQKLQIGKIRNDVKVIPSKTKIKKKFKPKRKEPRSKKNNKSKLKRKSKVNSHEETNSNPLREEKHEKMKMSYGMTKIEIEESRKKLGLTNDKGKQLEEQTEKEQEELVSKAYENMDTQFGDQHGENRWNMKKRSWFHRFKRALGLDKNE